MSLSRRQIVLAATALALGPGRGRAAALAQAPITLLNGKMFVQVSVNGAPATAMVDSGADRNALDMAFARRARVRLGMPTVMRGIQGFQGARLASRVTFFIGGVEITGPAVALDYGPLAARAHHDIDAVVGGGVFHAYVVELDFDGMTLSLHDRRQFQAPAGTRAISLTPRGNLMCAALTVEGRGPVQAVVDLGSNVPLILSPGPAQKLGLMDARPASTARMSGHGPSAVARVITAARLGLAGEEVQRVPTLIAPKSIGFDGNLGLPVLQRFRLYLDFAGARMWLGEPSGDRDEPFQRDRTGLEADLEGDNLRIAHIAANSPAAAAGWRVGELITAINGEPAAQANLDLSLSAAPGQSLTFTLSDGSTRQLVLADYY